MKTRLALAKCNPRRTVNPVVAARYIRVEVTCIALKVFKSRHDLWKIQHEMYKNRTFPLQSSSYSLK